MKGVLPKSTARADRPAAGGLKPPNPDQSPRPPSAAKRQPWDVSAAVTLPDAADRAQRLARSDPQGRYGNSEVARVATLQNPPPPGARAKATGTLPEAGAVGTKRVGGRGQPSPNPGAAKAAVEARHAADKKKDQGKAGGKADPGAKARTPAAKGTAAAGAQAEKKGAPDKGGVQSDGGDSAVADTGGTAGSAGGGGEISAPASPPVQRPRLEGTDATILKVPPLADQQRERVRLQTGLTVAEHYARAQVHLDRLSSRAKSEQLAIVLHIELIESEVRRDLENAAALIGPATENGIGRVRDACAGARADIMSASKDALAIIEKNASDADRKVDAAALSSKEAVEKAVATSSPQVRALHEETMKPIREMLKRQGEAFAKAAEKQGDALVTAGQKLAPDPDLVGGDAIAQAIAEKKQTVATDNMKSAREGFIDAGKRAQQDILATEPSLSLSFLLFVNPVAVKVERVGGADGKTVVEKGGEVRLRLANDYERAKGFVDETTKRALKALDALEQSAVKHLRQMRQSLEVMAHARREQLSAAILAGQAPAAEAWAQQMRGVNELAAGGELVDCRRLEPRFVEALDAMNALSARQRLDFDAQARSGFDEARAGMDEDRRSLDEAADSFISSARDTRQQATTLRQFAATLAKGFHGVANASGTAAADFRLKAEEKLGLSVTDTRKQMADLCKTTDLSMSEAAVKFALSLGQQGIKVTANVATLIAMVDVDVINDLADRSRRCVKAMDKAGTDETGLFEALYGMTPRYGAALCEYWNRADHAHDLWWWLDDELSGDEYWTAYYYLKGDPVKAVQYQLKASIHWYGDDTPQMESGLRALTPEQLKKLNNDPGFKETREKVEGSLKGTNLLVVQALLAGRAARADALRLKDDIDRARAAGNDDKLHDLLSKIDPHRLPEVRTEFVDVLKGNPMLDQKPVTPTEQEAREQENATFTTYITRPVEVYEPGMGEGDPGRYVTRTLSEPSRNLAVALATTGEGSTESRVARLAYETTRGGKPRPDKLALALDDPELVAARANPVLKQPDAKPEERKEAEEALQKLEARRAKVMLEFAKVKGADLKTQMDPQKAQAFTENAVADLFGDDPLGRELGSSMVKDGRAKPAVAIKYAVRGWGTNEELIRKTLRGMSAAEIAELKADYAERFGGEGKEKNANQLFDDLGVFQNADTAKVAGVSHATGGGFFTELSGDERQEVEELLLGKPQNDRDRMRLARLKYQHQKGEGSTWVTGAVLALEDSDLNSANLGVAAKHRPPGAFANKSLDMNRSRMEEMIADAGGEDQAFDEKGNFKGVPGKHSPNDFRLRVAATSEMAENYKAHIDSLVDMITGAIAIIGAIVGTIVVTVLTLGTATPFVIGAWAAGIAAATGAAAMATKYALKGSRYGWEEAAVDGAMTLVDAATAGLTAGAGAKAARAAAQMAALKAAARTPAQEAVAAGLIKQQARKELARGFVRAAGASGASGTARTAMSDGTWDEGFLTGLGRSVKGGVHAATIGVATHGASTGFSRTLGQGLGNSTSYLKRGLGSGLGGALGGMAGRSTEVGLDMLGGHAQGNMEDVFASIAMAGGRGFAENFAQGMAEVPKARRDAARDIHVENQKIADAERVARSGMSDADVAGDLKFRRMAAAAALANDPKVNAKAFLADLDAQVSADRTLVETHRQMVREFRREALASIPEHRRGEFADVRIQVLPDAQFEAFTGSLSGRAVTLFIDGEPRIVVRRSATPEALREEGIHLLQAREPRWREKIGRLDEKTMARWHELDLETQLSLYRDKIEVEIDAQQRLRKDLLDEAESTSDPARRSALRTRAEEAAETLKALQARGEEVNAIGPEKIAAMRRGDEPRPQYLREPARLFSKVSKPKRDMSVAELHPANAERKRATPLAHEDEQEIENATRTDVDLRNSTWEKDYPGHRLKQVGDGWFEWEDFTNTKGQASQRIRWYRMVEVIDPITGEVVDRRREILQIGKNRRWQQRGSESTARGAVFEEASRLRTLATLEQTLGRKIRPNEDLVVPIGALTREEDGKPLSAQHGGGAGFDDVVFRFRNFNGQLVADIVIIEAKGYNRALTLEDFSAITRNLPDNLEQLSAAITRSNFSEARIEAVRAAIRERRLSFEVHVSQTTRIGDITSERASILRTIVDTEEARRQLAAARRRFAEIREQDPDFTQAEAAQLQKDVQALGRLETRLKKAYEKEPFDAAEVQRVLRAILEGTSSVDSAADIAGRHDLQLRDRRVLIRRVAIDTDKADKPFFDAAQDSLRKKGRPAGPLIATPPGLVSQGAEPVATAPIVPVNLSVVRNPMTKETEGTTRLPVIAATPGESSAASIEIAKLLRDGVTLADGGIRRLDRLTWDTAGANTEQVATVLGQVRKALQASPHDAARFSVTITAMKTTSEADLRAALGLSRGVRFELLARAPDGSLTWKITFEPEWVKKGK